jgi:hypothetical protein
VKDLNKENICRRESGGREMGVNMGIGSSLLELMVIASHFMATSCSKSPIMARIHPLRVLIACITLP